MPRIELGWMQGIPRRSAAGDSYAPAARLAPARRLRPRPTGAVALATLLLSIMQLTGCHRNRHRPYAPPPPPIGASSPRHPEPNPTEAEREPIPKPRGRPEFVETGMASWYGPSGHHAADGSRYNGNDMTAAHKTLPLGTVARVTNLSNDESVVVRITDRGPFSHGRIIDLSERAAKQIGLYRMGVARVRVEAYTHETARADGRWCVQTGAFRTMRAALDLKAALARRYAGSYVIEFAGATGYWVRIDPVNHERTEAVAIMKWIGTPFPDVTPYLVRTN